MKKKKYTLDVSLDDYITIIMALDNTKNRAQMSANRCKDNTILGNAYLQEVKINGELRERLEKQKLKQDQAAA